MMTTKTYDLMIAEMPAALNITYDPLPENTTIDHARAQYKELAEYVKNAAEQAKADQP